MQNFTLTFSCCFLASWHDSILVTLRPSSVITHLISPQFTLCLLLLGYPAMSASTFHCQHKGRSSWDTDLSFMTCRISGSLLCSHQNPCNFCKDRDDRAWSSQDTRVSKVERDCEMGLSSSLLVLSSSGCLSLSKYFEQCCKGTPTVGAPQLCLNTP